MTATIEAPGASTAETLESFDSLKLRLIQHVLGISEHEKLLEMEAIFSQEDTGYSEGEMAFLDERFDESKNSPAEGISLERYLLGRPQK